MGQTNLAVLTGDRINEGFFTRKFMATFPGSQKSGRNNEVSLLPRWPYGGVSLYVSGNGSLAL